MQKENGVAGEVVVKEIDFKQTFQILSSNWRLLIVGPIFSGLLALGVSFLIKPTFTAVTKILPPQQQSAASAMLQNLGSLSGLAGVASGIKNPVEQYVAFLRSRTLGEALIDRFSLKSRYDVKLKEDALMALTSNTHINVGKDGLIAIEVDDKEPKFAAELANAYVDELSKLLGRLAITEAQQRRLFFEKQLQQTKLNLTKAEQLLREVGVNESSLKANPTAAIASIAQIQSQINAQAVKVKSMRAYLTQEAPALKQAESELAALRAQSVNNASQGALASGDMDYISRYRDMKYQENLYEIFSRQYELARVDEAKDYSMIQILDVANVPERKSRPKKAIIAISVSAFSELVFLLYAFLFRTRTASKMKVELE